MWGKFFLTATLFMGSTASARLRGTDSSGGGKAIVCRDGNRAIQSIELLDLFEAHAIYGLKVNVPGITSGDILYEVQQKLATLLPMEFGNQIPDQDLIAKAVTDFHLIESGKRLKPIDDAAEVVLEPGCGLEQLAYYLEDRSLLVDPELWSALDETNRAALMVHEALFRQERSLSHAKDSRHARKIVAYLFSSYPLTPVLQDVPAAAQECRTELNNDPSLDSAFLFYLYPNPLAKNESLARFAIIRNQLVYSETYTRVAAKPTSPQGLVPLTVYSDLEPQVTLKLRLAKGSRKGGNKAYYLQEADGRHMIHCRSVYGEKGTGGNSVSVLPQTPIVFTSDLMAGGKLYAHPWFKVQYSLHAKTAMTLLAYEEKIWAPDGSVRVQRTDLPSPKEIPAGGSEDLEIHYVSSLSQSPGMGYGYRVEVHALGWLGTIRHPRRSLNLTTHYRTQ